MTRTCVGHTPTRPGKSSLTGPSRTAHTCGGRPGPRRIGCSGLCDLPFATRRVTADALDRPRQATRPTDLDVHRRLLDLDTSTVWTPGTVLTPAKASTITLTDAAPDPELLGFSESVMKTLPAYRTRVTDRDGDVLAVRKKPDLGIEADAHRK